MNVIRLPYRMHPAISWRRISCLTLALVLLPRVTPADPAPSATETQQAAYRSSIAEEGVRRDADKIEAELRTVVTEMQTNGLDPAGAGTVLRSSNELSNLSAQDMQKVVDLLQAASLATAKDDQQEQMVTAYQDQQDLTIKLRTLALALATDNSPDALPQKIQELLARQIGNLRETTALAATVASTADVRLQPRGALVKAEQTSIGSEIELLNQTLTAVVAQPSAPGEAAVDLAKTLLAAITASDLRNRAAAATQSTQTAPLAEAATKQTAVRDALTEMLRLALSKEDALDRLNETKEQLSEVQAEQKDVDAATDQKKSDPASLADQQKRVLDHLAVTRALTEAENPEVTRQLQQAQAAMQQSDHDLAAATDPTAVRTAQDQSEQALDAAQKALDQQIASTDSEQKESLTQQVADLQKLDDAVAQAQQQAQALAASAPPPTSANAPAPQASPTAQAAQALAAETTKLAQQAAGPSPTTADDLAKATSDLQQAQPDAKAAAQSLAQAASDLKQEMNAMAGPAKQLAQLQQADSLVQQAEQQATDGKGQLDTTAPAMTEAARSLAQAEGISAAVGQNPNATLPGNVKQALNQAADALKNASLQAVLGQKTGARGLAQKGIGALQRAEKSLGQAMQQQQQLGMADAQKAMGLAESRQNQVIAGNGSNGGLIKGGPDDFKGKAQVVVGLSPRDRAAIAQARAEKAPPEFAPLVQQYLKNLADSAAAAK